MCSASSPKVRAIDGSYSRRYRSLPARVFVRKYRSEHRYPRCSLRSADTTQRWNFTKPRVRIAAISRSLILFVQRITQTRLSFRSILLSVQLAHFLPGSVNRKLYGAANAIGGRGRKGNSAAPQRPVSALKLLVELLITLSKRPSNEEILRGFVTSKIITSFHMNSHARGDAREACCLTTNVHAGRSARDR